LDLGRPYPAVSTPVPLYIQRMPSSTAPELHRLLAAIDLHEREAAWAAFVHAFTEPILGALRSLGRDHDLLMDRYAYVLEHLRADDYRRLRAFVEPAHTDFRLWLFVVARRLALDHYRHRYGRPRVADRQQAEVGEERASRRRLVDLVSAEVDPAELSSPGDGGPEAEFARRERDRLLQQCVDALLPRDQLLLRLKFAEELSAREIAGLMSFPSAAHVYRRLEAVLGSLRQEVSRIGLEGVEP
jgi:RNA polymerase sigma factor (sigma-70 family)